MQAFANRMITDHTAVNKQAVALVTKLHVTPEENDTSKALNSIDKVLIPKAKSAELKALLEKVRPAIDAHLKHAEKMQASMSKSG